MEGTVLHRDFSAEVGREHGRPVGSIEFGRAAPASAVLRGAVEPALPENGLLAVVRSKFHAEDHGGRVSLSNQSAPRHRHHERRHHALHQSRHGSLALLYSRNPLFFTIIDSTYQNLHRIPRELLDPWKNVFILPAFQLTERFRNRILQSGNPVGAYSGR